MPQQKISSLHQTLTGNDLQFILPLGNPSLISTTTIQNPSIWAYQFTYTAITELYGDTMHYIYGLQYYCTSASEHN